MDTEILCSKSWCKTHLPAGHRWKQCEHCRAQDAATKRTKWEKKKANTENLVLSSPLAKKREHAETVSTSDEEDERQQQGSVNRGRNLPAFLEDEDEELNVKGEKVSI